MDKKTIKLDDTEIEEYKFYQNESPMSINDIDVNEAVVSNKLPFSKQNISLVTKRIKIFKSLCIYFPKRCTYRSFDKNKCIYFLTKEHNVSNIMKLAKKLAIQ